MSRSPQQHRVEAAVRCIVRAFEDYNASFSDITRRAKRRFLSHDRQGMTQDINERFALYDTAIHDAIGRLEQILIERLFSRAIWVQIRHEYEKATEGVTDAKLYQTFFNTLSRRLFKTTGVDPAVEFTLDDRPTSAWVDPPTTGHHLSLQDRAGLESFLMALAAPWSTATAMADIDYHAVSERLAEAYPSPDASLAIEMLTPCFYRAGRAYRVGRVCKAGAHQPIVFAFKSADGVVSCEAVLTQTREISILFGYTFNYFMADLDAVEPVIEFLSDLLPSKPRAELYTVLGRVKQGKTERYQSFFSYLLAHPEEKMVEAEGKKGMVMLVLTLPGYPVVFKLIRDRFAPSKTVTRTDVLERYHLVFKHDRVGRLIDAQEFRELKLPLSSLSSELLDTLLTECARLVEITDGEVLIHHCYVERRVHPLDLYLASADERAAVKAVLDYGQAIKDLARSNIFAGDLLPKNFGVTGSGRVIFYDYDELRLLDECRFRHWPQTDDDVMSMSAEPWFHVGEDDVFPEQFPLFMGLNKERLNVLRAQHGELFDADWWQQTQAHVSQGHELDVPPFGPQARITRA
ncbi:MAG: bifunctional isocitrate dehydrogenase kinase/phosphatase [Wenzhouxiangella sp.]|nr:bifunctional isocitrate dehydrogenase kinase/phosphatase [Wenzhouxiangella sp.]